MSQRRARERRRSVRALGILPTPTATASEKVQLGLRLRTEASLTGRCACGAVQEIFEVLDGSLKPLPEMPATPGNRAFYVRIQHEDDCPAISPELERAYQRGEINDPGGDLLRSLHKKTDER